jgi:hypothetical protein
MFGFFGCWIVLWTTQGRVFGDPSYAGPSKERTYLITAKGSVYFVESYYGMRYKFADRGIVVFWLSGALGGVYLQRRKKKSKV